MHVIAGLRQALVMLVVATVVACAGAAAWFAVQGGVFRDKFGVALFVTAGLISVTGGTLLSRHMTNDARAALGAGPDREEPGTGSGLGPAGVFLFVCLPLAAGALVLLS